MFELQYFHSEDRTWTRYSEHETREEGRRAGQTFKYTRAAALQLLDPSGKIVDEWKQG